MTGKNLSEKVFLTGFMGAGKTAAGPILSRLLGVPFRDLDSLICERRPEGIEKIISSLGEPEFRRLESEILAEVCSFPGALVVSTGGGVVISEQNRLVMKESGVIIYLKASLETLMRRISKNAVRPLLKTGDPASRAAELFSGREAFYEESDLTIETDGLSAREVAEKAAGTLRLEGFLKKGA